MAMVVAVGAVLDLMAGGVTLPAEVAEGSAGEPGRWKFFGFAAAGSVGEEEKAVDGAGSETEFDSADFADFAADAEPGVADAGVVGRIEAILSFPPARSRSRSDLKHVVFVGDDDAVKFFAVF